MFLSPDISSRPGVTAIAAMAVLPGVLGYRTLRRTVQVRNPIPCFPSPQKPLLRKEKTGLLPTSRGFLV
jgi:hypothetical protein